MSVNKYLPHIHVLCEDDADRQIANGFLLDPALNLRAIQVLAFSRGWGHVLEEFKKNHHASMLAYPKRYMVLVIDFDEAEDRMERVKSVIPPDVADRVFVLGVQSEPEELRKDLGAWEDIGQKLAQDCRDNTFHTWNHRLLKHNSDELQRMMPILKPILFR